MTGNNSIGDKSFVSLHSVAHLIGICVPIINSGNAAHCPRYVIEKLFRHVDWHAKPGHVRAIGAPQVVQRVVDHIDRVVEQAF